MFSLSVASAVDLSNSSVEYYDDDFYNLNYDYGDYEYSEPCSMNSYGVEPAAGLYINSVICILGLVGNCLVIINYAFYKPIVDVYMLNVAVADLLFAAALPVIILNEAWDWTMGPLACKLLRGAYSVNLYSGMLLLACISTDHYVAFVQARRSVRLCSPFYKRVNCCVVWLLALALSFPTFYFYDTFRLTHLTTDYDGYEDYDATTVGSTVANNISDTPASLHAGVGYAVCKFRFENNATARQMAVLVPGTQMAMGLFLPLLIVVFCYSAVTDTLLRTKSFQRHKEVWVLLAVVAVFVACHFPYNISLLVDALTTFSVQTCAFAHAVQTAKTVTKTLAYLHCCLNPVLYALFRVRSRGTCCV